MAHPAAYSPPPLPPHAAAIRAQRAAMERARWRTLLELIRASLETLEAAPGRIRVPERMLAAVPPSALRECIVIRRAGFDGGARRSISWCLAEVYHETGGYAFLIWAWWDPPGK